MDYVTNEKMNEVKTKIKQHFPSKDGWKFSITKEHLSTINVAILEAPINFKSESVNVYYIAKHFKEQPEQRDVLLKIVSLIKGNDYYDHSDAMTDYFDTSYYFHVSIGKWDREFKFNDLGPVKINTGYESPESELQPQSN